MFSPVTLQVCNVPMGRDAAGAMRVLMARNVSVSTIIDFFLLGD